MVIEDFPKCPKCGKKLKVGLKEACCTNCKTLFFIKFEEVNLDNDSNTSKEFTLGLGGQWAGRGVRWW